MIRSTKWSATDIASLIEQSGVLKKPFSGDTVAALLARGQILTFDKGAIVLQRGEQSQRFFVLLRGTARLVAHTTDGREFVSLFIQPGNFWGVHPCLGDVAESHDALAETDIEVLAVPAPQMRDMMWEYRDFQENMVDFLCDRLRLAIEVAEQFATWTPRARLAWRILAIVNSHGKRSDASDIKEIAISQESLASMINLSRQRTNGLLKDFESDGLLSIRYGRLRVMDIAGLQALYDDPISS